MTSQKDFSKKTIITVNFTDKLELYRNYMPFLKNGGLFILTSTNYEMGDSVFIRLKLPEQEDLIPILCQIAWISPPSSTTKNSGVGLHFTKTNEPARDIIEKTLADILSSQKTTNTM